MANYITFTTIDETTNKIIQRYLYNKACSNNEDKEKYISDGIILIRKSIREKASTYRIEHCLESYRDLTYHLKDYKFIDPEINLIPFTPSLIMYSGDKFSKRKEKTCFHYN